MSKKALIITAFYNYDYQVRIYFLDSYLTQRGYEVTILSSDFNHRDKTNYFPQNNKLKLIHVPSYKKNLSIKRILSHFYFSRKCKEYCINNKPDIIYTIAPPNFLFKSLSSLKTKFSNTKLIFEIEDLWPESLPISYFFKIILSPILYIWKQIRDIYINNSDGIIFECNLFRDYLSKQLSSNLKTKTIYLTKNDTYRPLLSSVDSNTINILYLGSVNNLINMDFIIKIVSKIKKMKKVKLHIIGCGEQIEYFIKLCINSKVDYQYHGIIYDEKEKNNIIQICHFALNIMKESVFVGLTMKSLEYFHYGIPIINNIKGDSNSIIETYKCGINIDENNLNSVCEYIPKFIESQDYQIMRFNVRKAYIDLFCSEAYFKQIDLFFKELNI